MGKVNQSELSYQLAWARTYLSKYGVIHNSARSVWSITPDFVGVEVLDEKEIVSALVKKTQKDEIKPLYLPLKMKPQIFQMTTILATMMRNFQMK